MSLRLGYTVIGDKIGIILNPCRNNEVFDINYVVSNHNHNFLFKADSLLNLFPIPNCFSE